MKSMRVVVVVATGLFVALWWKALEPAYSAKPAYAISALNLRQCPDPGRRDAKACICPSGTSWTGEACVQVWSSSPRSIVSEHVGAIAEASSLHFARGQVPSLPADLTPWPNKVKAINSPVPVPGSVAMIDVPAGRNQDTGHVAVIEKVGENSLTIIEGNFELGSITRRTATGKDLDDAARQLRIVGYYQPGGQ